MHKGMRARFAVVAWNHGQAGELSVRLPLRDKVLRDSQPIGQQRVDLFRDLDVGEVALAGQDVQGGVADTLGHLMGTGNRHRGVFFA